MEFPRTYIKCPCADVHDNLHETPNIQNGDPKGSGFEEGEDQESSFNPRAPTSSYSLIPFDNLLYCEDCQQLKCSRCIIEEISSHFCPSCLFEMPASTVRSEGGRCARNCFECPVCTSPLAATSINSDPGLRGIQGPWILGCGYCHWSTLDVGLQFEKNTGLHNTLAKMSLGDSTKRSRIESLDEEVDPAPRQFSSLYSFYDGQLSSANPKRTLTSGSIDYSSPESIRHIVQAYTGQGSVKKSSRNEWMREALTKSEGLRTLDEAQEEDQIEKLRSGWRSTTSIAQRTNSCLQPRFVEELLPIQPLLRTKRSRRCAACHHILVRPEQKLHTTRFKIKLVARNYIPTVFLKPLQSSTAPMISLDALPPLRASQYLLTLRNPLFERVRITLASPSETPGKHAHKVTILCPDFDIGADVDQWNEVLGSSKDKHLSKFLNMKKVEYSGGEGGRIAEAGKVWDQGRNWTTVVLEVVCADVHRGDSNGLGEDEDTLEIPIFVRMDWEVDAQATGEDVGDKKGGRKEKEKRELAYWLALSVGRIGRLDGQKDP